LPCAFDSGLGRDCFFRQLHHAHGARISQSDYRKLPDEDRLTDAMRSAVTSKHLFDNVIYAPLTAVTFGWLWPKSL
jgi:hypothetical protein